MKQFGDLFLPRVIWLFRRKKRLPNVLALLLFFYTGALIVGCGQKPIHLAIESSKFLNRDDSRASLPVVVRIYQLTSKNQFENADFQTLWKQDQQILEGDILDRQEITLSPDSSIVLNLNPTKNPAYLAIVALFRKPQGENWRQIVPLQTPKVRSLKITVHEQSIKMVVIK